MNTSSRLRSIDTKSSFRIFPAGPTNGRPCLSSCFPGASPIKSILAFGLPAPGTAFVAYLCKGHLVQAFTWLAIFSRDSMTIISYHNYINPVLFLFDMNKQLRTAGIFGIVSLILLIPMTAFKVMVDNWFGGMSGLPAYYLVLYVALSLISTAFGILFLLGFVVLAKKLKIRLLEVVSYLLIIFSVLFVLADLAVSFYVPKEGILFLVFSVGMVFIVGVLSIPYGIALLKLKQFGGVATAAGVLNIILGVSFITILLSPLGLILIFPATILEIMIMFRASRELK